MNSRVVNLNLNVRYQLRSRINQLQTENTWPARELDHGKDLALTDLRAGDLNDKKANGLQRDPHAAEGYIFGICNSEL